MRQQFKLPVLGIAMACALVLGGCQTTTSSSSKVATNVDTKNAYQKGVYDPQAALTYYEPLYKTRSTETEIALGYGQALRQTGNAQRAVVVLATHARKKNPDPGIVLEFAAANAAVGRYDIAQEFAEKLKEDPLYGPRARHILGVALDAQGNHKAAEQAYRDALLRWEGDPTPVMNNLALSLAYQGFLDQALEELRKAHALAPEREEIKRNMKIVQDLRDSVIPKP